ncbi:MAG: aldehyde ferredoxin oxidoreductase C-terminal domain-containing protein, partial [Desulfitobacteriaceae bacterium]
AKGKGNMVKWSEDFVGLSDMLGICKLGWTYYSSTMPRLINKGLTLPSRLFQAVTGMELTEKELSAAAERVTNLERAYLTLQGISRKDEVFPDRITKEPLPEGPSKGSVHESDLMLDEYFKARGWDVETGIPTEGTLRRLDLEAVIDKFKAKGLL